MLDSNNIYKLIKRAKDKNCNSTDPMKRIIPNPIKFVYSFTLNSGNKPYIDDNIKINYKEKKEDKNNKQILKSKKEKKEENQSENIKKIQKEKEINDEKNKVILKEKNNNNYEKKDNQLSYNSNEQKNINILLFIISF